MLASITTTTPLEAPLSKFTPTCNLQSFTLTGLSSIECPFSSFSSSVPMDSFDSQLPEDRRLCQLNGTVLDSLLDVLEPCQQLKYLGIRGG